MNLLWITTSFPRWPGDWQGHFIAAAARSLAQRGHALHVLCPIAAGVTESIDWPGIRVRRFRYAPLARWACLAYGAGILDNLRRRPWLYLLVPFFLRAMARAIAEEIESCDLVHAHWAPCGAMAVAACRRRHRPLVVSLRGSDATSPSLWLRRWVRQVCDTSDAIICANEHIRRLAQNAGAAVEKLHILTGGIDWESFAALPAREEARWRLSLPQDGLLVISVGRLVPLKRHEILLRAISRLPSDVPPPRLAFVGDGPERGRLRNLAKALAMDDRVHFTGDLPQQTVLLWLRASDIFALASAHEGRSNALAEAMAAGLPCLVAPGAESGLLRGAPEPCGLVVEDGEWTSALERLLRDIALRQALGAAARRRAEEAVASWAEHAEELERIYRLCLGQRAGNKMTEAAKGD